MTKGLVIQPNGDYEVRDINGLDDLYAACGSENLDWASPGPLNYTCFGYALYEREFNPVATKLYHQTHPDYLSDPLCGPVVVQGPVVNEDETDIPAWAVRRVKEIVAELGPEQIAEQAVPLSDEDQMRIMTKMTHAQDQAQAALNEGKAVDFGGIMVGPEDAVAQAAQAAVGQIRSFWPEGDGQHRMPGF